MNRNEIISNINIINTNIICFIINLIRDIIIQQQNHSQAKTDNLVTQCKNEPNSPLTPIFPTILNATLNANILKNAIII